ncbi:MAG: hypothetical protein CFK52_04845 [Chloracidobacterium sp. CP2_5A]|nr:MAG: hypothetical protein CFK52_04845 [Chloracidobacterium sp. CP2_5A]
MREAKAKRAFRGDVAALGRARAGPLWTARLSGALSATISKRLALRLLQKASWLTRCRAEARF